jgi:dipeptidyl aminopeptidase/acylaminoacyl peptidase
MSRLAFVLPALCAGGLAAATSPALATFPGQNGRIAFDSVKGGNVDIWTMRPAGGGLRNLTADSEAVDASANWSPDGRRIVFMSDRSTARNPDPRGKRGPDFELFVMNANGADPRQITSNDFDDEDPAWSADATRVVFARDLNPVRGKVDYDLSRSRPTAPMSAGSRTVAAWMTSSPAGHRGKRSPSPATATATPRSTRCAPTDRSSGS